MLIRKAFEGEAVLMLPQALDNAANGHLELARRVKIIMLTYNSIELI